MTDENLPDERLTLKELAAFLELSLECAVRACSNGLRFEFLRSEASLFGSSSMAHRASAYARHAVEMPVPRGLRFLARCRSGASGGRQGMIRMGCDGYAR